MEIKGFYIGILLVYLLSLPLISAEIIIDEQPESIYNLGDLITIPVTLKSTSGITGNFQMNLICSGQEMNFYKNGISLSPGEEKKVESSLILSKAIIGSLKKHSLLRRMIKIIKCHGKNIPLL